MHSKKVSPLQIEVSYNGETCDKIDADQCFIVAAHSEIDTNVCIESDSAEENLEFYKLILEDILRFKNKLKDKKIPIEILNEIEQKILKE